MTDTDTEIDRYVEYGVEFSDGDGPVELGDNPGLADIARHVQGHIAANPDAEPVPFMAGTFAMYGTPQGGIVVVMDLPEQTPVGRPGVSRTYMPPAMVRVIDVITSGGSKMEILKAVGRALTSGGSKPKAIGDGKR